MEFLQRQLKNLKDALKKCLDKRNKLTRSGAAASSLPKCKFFDQMQFLHERTANKLTKSNIIQEVPMEEIVISETPQLLDVSNGSTVKRKAADMQVPPAKSRNGFKSRQDAFDKAILKELESTNDAIKSMTTPTTDDDNEVTLYCKSLVPIISSLPLKKKRLAMIKVSQLLFDIEFDNG